MFFNYENTLQTVGAMWTVSLIGYLCFRFRVFSFHDLGPILEVNLLCFLPGLVFLHLSRHKTTYDEWKPFFPIAICQLIFHLIALGLAFILKKKNNFIMQYLKTVASIGFSEYTVFIYYVIDVVAGTQYQILAIFYLVLQEFIYLPIFKVLHFLVFHKDSYDNENGSKSIGKFKNDNEDEHNLSDIESQQNNEGKSSNNEHHDEYDLPEADGVVMDHQDKVIIDKETGNPVHIVTERPANTEEEEEEQLEKETSLLMAIVKAWVNPTTICILVGIIWGATGVTVPDILVNLANDLGKTVSGVILFLMGGYCSTIPIKSFSVWTVPVIFYKYVVCPLIVGGFCKLFKLEKLVTQIVVLMACAPLALPPIKSLGISEQTKNARGIYLFTTILYLPFSFLWTIVLIETNIF